MNIDMLKEQLAKPINVDGEPWLRGTDEVFDPLGDISLPIGSYSSAFDDMAILVLDNILNKRWGGDHGEELAHEMFREMLCTAGICDYGTSPRGCFPDWSVDGIEELLTTLLSKWREYAAAEWTES